VFPIVPSAPTVRTVRASFPRAGKGFVSIFIHRKIRNSLHAKTSPCPPTEMTSRQRVLAALKREPLDRVPRLLYGEAIGYTPPVERLLGEHCRPQSPREFFGMDITGVTPEPTRLSRERFVPWFREQPPSATTGGEVDEWGVRWRAGGFHHFAEIESPLRGIDDRARIEEYPWPDLDQPYRFEKLRQGVKLLHAEGMAVAGFAGSVFEQSWYIRGMEDLMMDLVTAPDLARYLFERTAAFQREVARQFALAGVDIIITGDDVAGQQGLLMSRETWLEFLQPSLAATVETVKRANPASFVFYHSDGNIEPLIPDLIETGIDILNPVQPECMDPAAIKQKYGDRLSFWGTVSVQRTMPSEAPGRSGPKCRTGSEKWEGAAASSSLPRTCWGRKCRGKTSLPFSRRLMKWRAATETENKNATTLESMPSSQPLKLACIGCGARAQTYTELATRRPDRYQVVAGADPIAERVEKIRAISGHPDFRAFTDAGAILAAGKLADVMIVATQDNSHFANCRGALQTRL
jgi:uroporphyrinogen decarboxylase